MATGMVGEPFLDAHSYEAWQQFWRLAGVDHLHVSGLHNKFSESDESVIRPAQAVQHPIASSSN